MIPILYDTKETGFASNGLGRLHSCISAVVFEERNGLYELDFEYPVDGEHFDLIQIGRIVGVTHDDSGDVQPFDIVSYTKPIDGKVTFHAVHISYRQSYLTANGTNINSLADAFTMLGNAQPSNPFVYRTDKTSTGYMSSADGIPKTVRQMLGGIEGSILDAYGGEYEWDKFNVILHANRGQYRNFAIRYGVNMLDYEEECDSSGSYSSCVPYWTDGTVTVVGDRQVYSSSTVTGRGECIPLDVSDKFESQPTKAQVEAMGVQVMNAQKPALPAQTIKVSFVRIQDMDESYQTLMQCNLCDTINVVFPFYDVTERFKIVKTEWNVLRDKYESMELGDLSVTLSEALGITQQSGEAKQTTLDLLWTHSSGATSQVSTMGSDEITLNAETTPYKGLLCEFRCFYNSGERTYGYDMFGASGMFARESVTRATGNPMISYTRTWYPSGTNKVVFSDCTRVSSNATNVTGSDTGCLVPLRIWGVK